MTQTYILCGGMMIFANGTKTALCHFYGHRCVVLGVPHAPPHVIMSLWRGEAMVVLFISQIASRKNQVFSGCQQDKEDMSSFEK